MERTFGRLAPVCFAVCLMAPYPADAADAGKDLLAAASQGRADTVTTLLGKGAPIETTDKSGRTALMLAAQHGHAAAVRVLLAKGANAAARDAHGATAWVLATFSPAGPSGGIDEVLTILPRPSRPRLAVEAGWSEANLYSSCSMRPGQLTEHVNQLQPDVLALTAFRRFAGVSGKQLVEIAGANGRGVAAVPNDQAFADTDAVLVLVVRPGAACQPQQTGDNLTLTIDVQLLRAKDRAVLLRKSFGGGLKGLHAQVVTGQAQYFPVYEEWIKQHAEQIYWAAVEAWFRAA
jgi:hypothetical protein